MGDWGARIPPVGSEERSKRDAAARVLRGVVTGELVRSTDVAEGLDIIPQRLWPMVSAALFDTDPVQEPLRTRLDEARRAASMTWLLRKRTVGRINAAFGRAGLDAVFLKGVAIAEQALDDPALRQMSDVDVWVRDRWSDAVAVLKEGGFAVPARHGAGVHGVGVSTAVLEDTSGPMPIHVEVHDVPLSMARLPDAHIDALWDQRVTLPSSGVAALRPPHLLIHVCLHVSGLGRFSAGLSSLVDIGLVLRAHGPAMDWDEWIAWVRSGRVSARVWTALTLASELVGADVPAVALAGLEPANSAELLALAEDQVWIDERQLLPALEQAVRGGGSGRRWFRSRLGRTAGASRRFAGAAPEGPKRGSFLGDLKLKIPVYWHFVRDGGVAMVRRRAGAARRRGRIDRLLEKADDVVPESADRPPL